MSKYTSEQYNKVFWKLPQEIRDVVSSFETTKHIQIVAEKHNLQIDKTGELVDVTLDVMMGIIATRDFVKELQDALQIGALEASVLARDVDDNIFKPIKTTIEHLYAGRAPYKPSSSLVQYYDEDEEHPSLNKETLLKEIEDPTPAEVKKEIMIPKEEPKVVPIEEIKPEIVIQNQNVVEKPTEKPHTEIIEYHEEISNTPIVSPIKTNSMIQDTKKIALPPIKIIEPESLEPKKNADADKMKGDSILNQLASIKLSQAFVMPKGPEGIQELRTLQETSMKLGGNVEIPKEKPIEPAPQITLTPEPAAAKEVPISLPKSTNIQSVIEVVKSSETKIDPYRERI
ncbi:MAG: hypothetical protein JWP09_578 [Candidatus Taylorbacteria bacterium]|nr:hypothetical protein [Candidatus Taylorbacteria bacterium]